MESFSLCFIKYNTFYIYICNIVITPCSLIQCDKPIVWAYDRETNLNAPFLTVLPACVLFESKSKW